MRKIFIVHASIVDSNGNFTAEISGYPKSFDTNSYNGDLEKTRRRADGDMATVWGQMCNRDDRQIQSVWMVDETGKLLANRSYGTFIEVVEPQE